MKRRDGLRVQMVIILSTLLLAAPSVYAAGSDLVSQLVDSLGVTEAQAKGGAGAIFDLAKSKLSSEDFSKLA